MCIYWNIFKDKEDDNLIKHFCLKQLIVPILKVIQMYKQTGKHRTSSMLNNIFYHIAEDGTSFLLFPQ